jgi:hypothetical protein
MTYSGSESFDQYLELSAECAIIRPQVSKPESDTIYRKTSTSGSGTARLIEKLHKYKLSLEGRKPEVKSKEFKPRARGGKGDDSWPEYAKISANVEETDIAS